MIDIVLIIIFLISLGALLILVSPKLPELAAVPQEEIDRYIDHRYGVVVVPYRRAKKFYEEGRWKSVAFDYCGRILHRLHIVLMRLDNGVVGILKRVRSRLGVANGNGEQQPVGKAESGE